MSLSRSPGRRAVRPTCDTLEARSLMSTLALTGHPRAAHFAPFRFPAPFPFPVMPGPVIPNLPATPTVSASTIPANGDVNPYGVAIVPAAGFFYSGLLHQGDVLVSNFNASSNIQGTGTTIVAVSPTGQRSLFFTSKEPGLSTALGVLSGGFVVVGNAPTPDATLAHMGIGSLQFVDRFGNVALKLTDSRLLAGPWDLTVNDAGALAQVFVSNALTGTVTRIDLSVSPIFNQVKVLKMTQIASGYTVTPSAAAVVLAPTGLAYDRRSDTLYVASTGDNAIYAVPHAAYGTTDVGKGRLVFNDPAHLNGPLGLALAPNGDLLTTNGDAFTATPPPGLPPSGLIEFTPGGQFVAQRALDPNPGGAFGLALGTINGRVTLATVNDNQNNLNLWAVANMPPWYG